MHRTALCLTALLLLSPPAGTLADDDGFSSIFNGKDLTGWRADSDYWSVQEGAITAMTTEQNKLTYNTFCIWEGGQPSDFVLRLKYRIVGGNSGVQYRSRVVDEEKFVVSGYQADIDSSPRYSGINYEEKARGILAERGESVTLTGEKDKHIVRFAAAADLQNHIRPEQ